MEEENFFPSINQQSLRDIEIYQNNYLKKMSQDNKIKEMVEVIHIRRWPAEHYRKISRCPYYKCQKACKNPFLLNKHLKKEHEEVFKLGLEVNTQTGKFIIPESALDYGLLLCKIYPKFAAQILR